MWLSSIFIWSFLILKKYSYKLWVIFQRITPFYSKFNYPKISELEKFGHATILTDEIETEPIEPNNQFSFVEYSNAIISIINGSYQKCSIGIYGKWGTGKTTLMKLIERRLRPTIFNWKNVPGQDNNKLKEYLIKNFDGTEWLNDNNIKFDKEGKTLTISKPPHYISIVLDIENGKALLEIDHTKLYEFAAEEEVIKEKERIKRFDRKKIDYMPAEIKENNVLTVWFNAWRYEQEEHLALIPLIKTIAYTMGEHQYYYHIKPILLRGLEILSKDIIRNLATRYLLTDTGMKELEEKLIPKLETLPEIDKDTIYFDGIQKIESEIKRIRRNFPQTRIVIFIDDLDRCSPETAVNIFESIKVFLDIEGFIFIVGLSRELLDQMIGLKLANAGLTNVQADEYIRKIIQIEILIPQWETLLLKN